MRPRSPLYGIIPALACILAAAGLAASAPDPGRLASKLTSAIEKGDVKQVETLLAQGAAPDRGAEATRRLGGASLRSPLLIKLTLTPLSSALSVENAPAAQKLVELLLSKGANPNAPDAVAVGSVAWVTCPLNMAVHRGEAPLVELLLSKGANPNGVENSSATPLYTATWEAGLMYLSTKSGGLRMLDPKIIEVLFAAGADVNRPVNGAMAIVSDDAKDAPALMQLAGFQANAGGVCPKGATPLHAAAMHGLSRWVSFYLAKGANANAKNEWGATPLHEAASRGKSFAIVKSLIAAGADVNAKTKSGDTPLHEAASRTWPGVKDVVQLLTANGASKTERNASGKTPLDIATEANNTELLGAL